MWAAREDGPGAARVWGQANCGANRARHLGVAKSFVLILSMASVFELHAHQTDQSQLAFRLW